MTDSGSGGGSGEIKRRVGEAKASLARAHDELAESVRKELAASRKKALDRV